MVFSLATLCALCGLLWTAAAAPLLLRGAGRKLQVEKKSRSMDSTRLVAPQCRPGYVDISGGQAYYWSCAFYCDGGAYFATKGCMCACLTPEQAEKVTPQGPTAPTASGPVTSATSQPGPGGVIVTTAGPRPSTPAPPVEHFPVGDLHGSGEPLPSVGGGSSSYSSYSGYSGDSGYIAEPRPSTTQMPARESGERPDLATLALIAGGCLVACAGVAVLCLAWTGRRKPKPDFRFADVPAVTIHRPEEKCPQPLEVQKAPWTPSKASTASTASGRSLGGSRVSSLSSASSSGGLRATCENQSLWAHRIDVENPGAGRHLTPQRVRGSSKLSKVQPEGSPEAGSRRSSACSKSSKTSVGSMQTSPC